MKEESIKKVGLKKMIIEEEGRKANIMPPLYTPTYVPSYIGKEILQAILSSKFAIKFNETLTIESNRNIHGLIRDIFKKKPSIEKNQERIIYHINFDTISISEYSYVLFGFTTALDQHDDSETFVKIIDNDDNSIINVDGMTDSVTNIVTAHACLLGYILQTDKKISIIVNKKDLEVRISNISF